MTEWKVKLVLVTGATGFVAQHIIRLLLQEGYRVRGTVRSLRDESKLKCLKNLCPDASYPLELVEADLTVDNGWSEAVEGCDYCIHVASPLPNGPPREEDDVIIPAVEGTIRVLRVCADSGKIKRVVLTSSIYSVHGETEGDENRVYTENDWTDSSSQYLDAYAKSKTLAEKAAWDFFRSLPSGSKMELSVVNPSIILGPCINGVICTSLLLIKRIMDRSSPLVANLYVSFCDVRDVALAHLRAMTEPEAANNRHIVTSDHMWHQDIAKLLHNEFHPYGYSVPIVSAPYFVHYLYSFLDENAALVLPRYGKMYTYSNTRMKEVLKIEPRDGISILKDTVHSLIECGLIHKTNLYAANSKNFSRTSNKIQTMH